MCIPNWEGSRVCKNDFHVPHVTILPIYAHITACIIFILVFLFLARFLFPAGSSWGAFRYHKHPTNSSFYSFLPIYFWFEGPALRRIGPARAHMSK